MTPDTASPPIASDLRRRLQQRYEQAMKLAGRTPRDHARMHALLAECLAADPGNILYLDALLANLRQWPRREPGWLARWLGRSAPSTQALGAGYQLLRVAPELLLHHRHDPLVLGRLAAAAAACELDEAELRYWRAARDIAPRDATTLRGLALALTRHGRFGEAIDPWQQIQSAAPDAQASQALAELQQFRENDEPVAADAPTDPAAAIALAQSLVQSGRFAAAEEVLLRAQAASGSDLSVLHQREELQLARSAHRLSVARRRAAADEHPRAQRLVAELETEHNRLEIDIFHLRSERHPDDPALRLELARRLVRAGNFSGAIVRLEEARGDPAIRPLVLLELGQCWQHLRQFAKAIEFYRQAIGAADGESEPLAAALYRLGVLAAALNQPGEARQALTRLLSLAPGYKDARQRLDNLP